jgi:hypothetical protein
VKASSAPPSVSSAETARIVAHDGARDFDFLIGDWKAHVRRLPERLVGSNTWVTYDGISNHKKVLGSNANFEEFEVDSPESHLHIRGQTLRLYNADSRQWRIYLVDGDTPKSISSGTPGQRVSDFDTEKWVGTRSHRLGGYAIACASLRTAGAIADSGVLPKPSTSPCRGGGGALASAP